MTLETNSLDRAKLSEYRMSTNEHVKHMSWRLTIVCLLSIISVGHSQSISTGEPSHVWKASWITGPDAPTKDECVLHFRKELELTSVPPVCHLHLS